MQLRFLALILLNLIVNACASTNKSPLKPIEKSYILDPALIKKVQGQGRITLLEHQLRPLDYLHKHPEIKGLLVNHYMGTGKTYLGIAFAESYPERPVVILAPSFLESHWQNQMAEFGVSDKKRYQFVSYANAPEFFAGKDLSNTLLVIDEAHNLLKYLRSFNSEDNSRYSQVYIKLRTAYRILGLTGTPVYDDESDLAYLINLVSGQDLMPFNQEAFRLAYTKIIPSRQFFRGFFSESNLVTTLFPSFTTLFLGALFGLPGFIAGIPVALLFTVGTNLIFNPNTYKFRELDTEKLSPVITKYMSYFKFDESQFKDFPGQEFKVEEVAYNKFQYSFFLRLVEGDLPTDQLQRLLHNSNKKLSDEEVKVNSSLIHEQIYSSPGAARDIGNFDFVDSQGKLIESPKFLAVYEELKKSEGPSVLYSNYYQTGILAFEAFLKRQDFKKPYAIITPEMKPELVNEIVSSYNTGKISLLMLHPDITEGISLKGTEKLHILEPMLNNTILEQVIGRTRRFQSHSHLPKEKQIVKVRMWLSTSSTWHPDLGVVNRANWYKRYRELAYMSRWGIGIAQIDKKYDRKALNPEELSYVKLQTLEKNLSQMQKMLTAQSIESHYAGKTEPH
jgi:hypothetical protein